MCERPQTWAKPAAERGIVRPLDSALPLMVRTPNNPGGVPIRVFDGFCTARAGNWGLPFLDAPTGPFCGVNRAREDGSARDAGLAEAARPPSNTPHLEGPTRSRSVPTDVTPLPRPGAGESCPG